MGAPGVRTTVVPLWPRTSAAVAAISNDMAMRERILWSWVMIVLLNLSTRNWNALLPDGLQPASDRCRPRPSTTVPQLLVTGTATKPWTWPLAAYRPTTAPSGLIPNVRVAAEPG